MTTTSLSIKQHFRKLKDPRRRHRRRHLLLDILVVAICGVISGCNSWTQIAAFGRKRHDWLKRFLTLPEGIPSHDTFKRTFERLDPVVFQNCFREWILALAGAVDIPHIAIDGKTVRRSGTTDLGPLHLVSAWATKNHLSLGQIAVDEKSNEITAIPKLLELLDLNGALVSIDAIGCQKEIAAKIRAKGGHYLLTVKGNQEQLLSDLQNCFEQACETDFVGLDHDTYTTQEKGHGRREERCYTIIRNPRGIRNHDAWRDLCVIGMCGSERTVNDQTTTEVRFFIGSKKASARYYGKALRHNWGIENNLHWQLDVNFGEDHNRTKERTAAQNLGLLRRLAVTLLKHHPDEESITCKRLQAAWNTDFLEEVIRGSVNLGHQ
jgi:predicted transposase YbfD/YdcC